MSSYDRQYAFFDRLLGRPVLLLTLFVTCLVIGVISYARIPVQMMPDGLTEPGLQIYLTNPGASAPENEEQVARILEEELRTLSGIVSIDSTSRQDTVSVSVDFKADTDMNFAKAEVRDRIERARPKLPRTVRDIGIWSWSESNLPVMYCALLHRGNSEKSDAIVENVIKRRLESVDGVGRVSIEGTLDDSLRILLDEDRVKAANLDLGALIRRLSADNFALPLGEVEDGGRRILLRSDMRFKSPHEIEAYPIGGGLTIADVGRVEPVKTVRDYLFRINGSEAYEVVLEKDGQANAVETCARLRQTMAELEKDPRLTGEFQFLVLFDQGDFIRNSMAALQRTALEGGLFAILILFVFLWRVRLTLLVALSIPISALLAVAWVYFGGGSFNVLTMTGITLAMGMLVDNSIVVVENIVRLKQLGTPTRQACAEGVGQVGLAVFLSTLTSVVVFVPLIFMSENPQLRIMFGELGKPLCISLLASLLAALVFLPVQVRGSLGARSPRMQRLAELLAPIGSIPARLLSGALGVVVSLVRLLLRALAGVSRALVAVLTPLRWPIAAGALVFAAWKVSRLKPVLAVIGDAAPFAVLPDKHSLMAMALAVLLMLAALAAAAIAAFGLPRWKKRAAPYEPAAVAAESRGHSIVGFVVAGNRALVDWSLKHRLAASIVAIVALLTICVPSCNMKVAAFGEDDNRSRLVFWVDLEENFTLEQVSAEFERYEHYLDSKKADYGFDRLSDSFRRNGGRVSLYWESPPGRAHIEHVQNDLQQSLPRLAGHRLRFVSGENNEAKNRSIVTFRLTGPDSEGLERVGLEAVKLLEAVPGLSGVRSPITNAPPQVRVKFDSDLAQQLGITAMAALQNISWALRGFQLPRYQEPGREVPLIIEYDDDVRGLATLRDLDVFGGESTAVALSSFSNLQFGRGSRSIDRHNGQASFKIQARVQDSSRQSELSEAGRHALEALDLPRGYALADADLANVRQEEEMKEIWSALLLSIVLVFLLMGILFESFLLPLSVLFTIPYAMLGAYWTLYITGTAMDSVGWIGIIILIGIVANHGVVLIDRVHTLRKQGMERSAAVLEGCGNRVRPVLMTTLTAVAGLLPLALSEPGGEGIDYRALATCVAGGMSMSTIFTLWVVPLVYTLLDDLGRVVGDRMHWSLRPLRARSGTPVVQESAVAPQ